MTPRPARIYRLGFIAGLALGVGLAVWRIRIGRGPFDAMLWGVGGLAMGLALAWMSVVGIRLQRRDVRQ
jgi:hypothetical protein